MAIKKTKEPKSKKSVQIKRSYKPILKAKDIPATQGMLDHLHKISRANMKSFNKRMDARFSQIESGIQMVLSEVHRMALMMKEQNKRNVFVLHGFHKQI